MYLYFDRTFSVTLVQQAAVREFNHQSLCDPAAHLHKVVIGLRINKEFGTVVF